MSSAPGTVLRAARAGLFAAVCVVLAAVGHSAASGHRVPLPVLAAAFAATGLLGWLGGRRQRGPAAIGGGLLAVQAGLHLLYGRFAVPPGGHGTPPAGHGAPANPSTMPHGHLAPGHLSHGSMPHGHMSHGAGGAAHQAGCAAELLHGSPAMLAGHLVAALLCAVWLWRGEAALFGLLRALAALAVPPLALRTALGPRRGTAPPPRVRPTTGPRRVRPGVGLLQHTVVPRGPPAGRAPSTTTPLPAAC